MAALKGRPTAGRPMPGLIIDVRMTIARGDRAAAIATLTQHPSVRRYLTAQELASIAEDIDTDEDARA